MSLVWFVIKDDIYWGSTINLLSIFLKQALIITGEIDNKDKCHNQFYIRQAGEPGVARGHDSKR